MRIFLIEEMIEDNADFFWVVIHKVKDQVRAAGLVKVVVEGVVNKNILLWTLKTKTLANNHTRRHDFRPN